MCLPLGHADPVGVVGGRGWCSQTPPASWPAPHAAVPAGLRLAWTTSSPVREYRVKPQPQPTSLRQWVSKRWILTDWLTDCSLCVSHVLSLGFILAFFFFLSDQKIYQSNGVGVNEWDHESGLTFFSWPIRSRRAATCLAAASPSISASTSFLSRMSTSLGPAPSCALRQWRNREPSSSLRPRLSSLWPCNLV